MVSLDNRFSRGFSLLSTLLCFQRLSSDRLIFCNLCSERTGGEVERRRRTGRGGAKGETGSDDHATDDCALVVPQRHSTKPLETVLCLPLLREADEDHAFPGTPERAGTVASAPAKVRETGHSQTAFRIPGPLAEAAAEPARTRPCSRSVTASRSTACSSRMRQAPS